MMHYTVIVQVKAVDTPATVRATAMKSPPARRARTYDEDDETPTPRRTVTDLVNVTVQAPDESSAIRKAMALLQVELDMPPINDDEMIDPRLISTIR